MQNDQVEEVKSKVDIVEIIGEKVNLKKAGRHFKGLCPFHSEKSPSFVVSAERQSYKCFGCQEGGDVISFLQKYEGYSFLEALEFLANKVGVTLKSFKPSAEDFGRKRILALLSLASEYYHYLLTKHESGQIARDYLKNRGVKNESITQYYLGFAPSQWRSVSDFLIRKKGYRLEELDAAGLIIKTQSGHYDRFRGRVIFPLRDHKGVVVGFSGRIISSIDSKQEAKYINSPETVVYHKSQMLYGLYENREIIRKEDSIVLVEGELDVIPSVQAGVKNVVAIKGSAFTQEQAQIISRYCHNILMSLDSDEAGQEAIKRAVNIAENLDLSIRVVQIVGGKDPGDVASQNPRSWREMVKSAVLYWDFLIDSAAFRVDPNSGDGMMKITKEVVPALAQINNKVVQAHYVNKLAFKLGVNEKVIYEEINRVVKKKQLTQLKGVVSTIEHGEKTRVTELGIYLLALALQNYDKLKEQTKSILPEWLGVGATSKIFAKLNGLGEKIFEVKTFIQDLPEELISVFDQAYLRDISMVNNVSQEWEKTLVELEEEYVRGKLKKITTQIGSLKAEETQKLQELKDEFGRLSRRLSELTK